MATSPKKSTSDRIKVGDGKGGNDDSGDGVGGDSIELTKKSEELKSQKSAKLQN